MLHCNVMCEELVDKEEIKLSVADIKKVCEHFHRKMPTVDKDKCFLED